MIVYRSYMRIWSLKSIIISLSPTMSTVNLISSDSVKFVVEESVAKKSELLKNMIEGTALII